MRTAILVATVLAITVELRAQVFSYECDTTPDEAGWELFQNFCDAEEWSANGFLFQHVEACREFPGNGQQIDYTKSLDDFLGVEDFFLWWTVSTDGEQSEIPFVAPVDLTTGNLGGVLYGITIASDQVNFFRDADFPPFFVDIEPGIPHSYYLELHGAESYALYIDGEVVHSGIPEGLLTAIFPQVNMRAKSVFVSSTAIWQSIRWGQIPLDASGDYDSDGIVDEGDLFYFAECAANSGEGIDAGPGCRFADFDFDTDVDCDDWLVFESLCGCSFGSDGDVDENGAVDFDDILCVLNGFAGNFDVCPFDAVDIFPCNGNAVIDFDDILAALEAFAGNPPCPNPCEP